VYNVQGFDWWSIDDTYKTIILNNCTVSSFVGCFLYYWQLNLFLNIYFFNVGTKLGALFIIINNSDTFLDSERWDLSQIGIDLELSMAEETIDRTYRCSRPIQILTQSHCYLSVSVPIFSRVNDLSHSKDQYLTE
jgi:hypothetical protein